MLEKHPSNYFLANFIGVGLGERNFLGPSKVIFKKCIELVPN